MPETSPYKKLTLILILGLLAFRVVALLLSPLNLHGDEAQYWSWAQNLDWGYYSKPPMVAWVIATTTAVFGDAEWAVRLGSPIIHSFTAWMLFLSGRKLAGGHAGFWAAAIYLLMPAVWLSSAIITTDVALMLFWATAIHAWISLRQSANWRYAVQLGAAIGLGLMSKYAMLFFLPALGLAVLFDRPTRQALLGAKGLAAGLLTLAIISPNLWWNASHEFATLSHTADNANLKQDMFHPGEMLSFLGDQFAVFGPVTMILMILALIAAFKRRLPAPAIWLAFLNATPLVIISLQALLSRANANWAATAYGAAPILIAIWAMNRPRGHSWLKWGVIAQSLIAAFMGIAILVPSWTDSFGMTNSIKRLRAWPETKSTIERLYARGHEGEAFAAIALDSRLHYYDLQYYGLAETAPLYMWMLQASPDNHAEMSAPLPVNRGKPVLLINYYNNYDSFFRADFRRLEQLDDIDINLGGGKRRRLRTFAAYDYTPTTEPIRVPKNP